MSQPLPTLVCFAVEEEARSFRRAACSAAHIRILVTGMGRQNAERACRPVLRASDLGLVLTCGFAGGLRPGLPGGTVLFEAEAKASLAEMLLASGGRSARFHCAERVASTVPEKWRLWEATGADAVEMESGIIRGLCREAGVASATVRVILDGAEEDLPLDFNKLMTPDQRLDARKLAIELARSPRNVGALWRLRRQSRAAAARLTVVLSRALLGPRAL